MAAAILGWLCIALGIISAAIAVLVVAGNAMGSVTSPDSVNLRPASIAALLALALWVGAWASFTYG